jgi:hypothetical protein
MPGSILSSIFVEQGVGGAACCERSIKQNRSRHGIKTKTLQEYVASRSTTASTNEACAIHPTDLPFWHTWRLLYTHLRMLCVRPTENFQLKAKTYPWQTKGTAAKHQIVKQHAQNIREGNRISNACSKSLFEHLSNQPQLSRRYAT